LRVPLRATLLLALALAIPACGPGTQQKNTAIPNAPLGLSATASTTTRIDLAWTDSSDNEFVFRIWRSDDGGATYALIATAAQNSATFIDIGLAAGTTYFYKVTAWNSRGDSAEAGPASATTLALVWTVASASGPLSGRGYHSMIYDDSGATPRVIVFGGYDSFLNFYNDLWEFSLPAIATSGAWTPIATTLGPSLSELPVIFGHSAVYDSTNDRMVVFGGQAQDTSNPLDFSNSVLILDLATGIWSKPTVSGSPPPKRAYHTAIFDTAHQRMIVHGGTDGGKELDDTYVLSLPAAGPLAWSGPLSGPRPAHREQHGAVYDFQQNRMLIFGGFDSDLTDGFPLNQDSWSLALNPTPSWSPLFLSGTPGFRMAHSASYDELNQRMVIFGGDRDSTLNLTDEMWGMRLGATPGWSLMVPTGAKPTARFAHTSVYDAVNQRIVIYGGLDSTFTELNDVWVIQM